MAWSVVLLTDLTGEPVGEVTNAYERNISFGLNRATTARFRVRLDNPLADRLLEGEVLCKQYEDQALRLVGEIETAGESSDASRQTVEVTVADPTGTRLPLRLCGKSASGYQKTTPTDRGAAASELIGLANAEADTGIRVGTITASASDTLGPWYYKPISEAIGELSGALDGFDWQLVPLEPALDGAGFPSPQPAIGTFTALPFIGIQQPEAIFEYGTGRHNVRDYRRTVTKQNLLNTAYSLPPGFPDASAGAVQTATDSVSVGRWGRREGVVPGDLSVEELRRKLTEEHVRIRKEPRQLITFTPVREDTTGGPPVPKFKLDYDLGDIVTFRAAVAESVRVDAAFRVYGVELAIDEEGGEQPTITLAGDGS